MIRLAFGAKCGGRGASGLAGCEAAASESAAPNSDSHSSDPNAIFPTPQPASLKKCRRVIARSASYFPISCSLIAPLSQSAIRKGPKRTRKRENTKPRIEQGYTGWPGNPKSVVADFI